MSKITRQVLLLAMLLFSVSLSAQNSNIHGLYVNGTATWLGDTAVENEILRYSQNQNFNYLTLYDLNFAWTQLQKNRMAAFITKAKTSYGIQQVAASGETYGFFRHVILPYNNGRTSQLEKFDVLNYEFEFWLMSSITAYYSAPYLAPNGFSSDTAGAFAFAWQEFQAIDLLCRNNGLISEIYLGWPNRGQMQKIASIADRILLHAYRTSDIDVYAYSRSRLDDIASVGIPVTVLPIFSSEPVFMQSWLQTHPISQPYHTYATDFAAETGPIRQSIRLGG